MAPSYEITTSILLCSEDSSSFLCFDEEAAAAVEVNGSSCGGVSMDYFPSPSEEYVATLVQTEAEHMPREDYSERLRRAGGVDLRVRMDAIDRIWKVHTYYNFGPVTACLAVNYLDHFLSLYQLPEGKAWMTQLLSVACVSLAAKMEETSVPLPLDMQVGDARYVFEAKTIQRMELLVLSTLRWRMQAVTPFSYIDYFLRELTGVNAPSRRSVRRSAELILCIARGGNFLDFRPSEIAASVAAAVAGEEGHAVDIHKAHTHVDKERVMCCHEAIQAMAPLISAAVQQPLPPPPKTAASHGSVPRSPTGVLDAAGCILSCVSDGTAASVASSASGSSPVNKRRKM